MLSRNLLKSKFFTFSYNKKRKEKINFPIFFLAKYWRLGFYVNFRKKWSPRLRSPTIFSFIQIRISKNLCMFPICKRDWLTHLTPHLPSYRNQSIDLLVTLAFNELNSISYLYGCISKGNFGKRSSCVQ